MRVHKSKYFYGNKISDYGLEHGYVDYRTLAMAFEGVMANDIIAKTDGIIGYWEQESGFVDNSDEIEELQKQIESYKEQIESLEYNIEEKSESYINEQIEVINGKIEELEEQIEELEEEQDYSAEIFQYFIVDNNGARILEECNEIVFYNEELDLYVWGVTHWGTSWDYCLTDIKIELDDELDY